MVVTEKATSSPARVPATRLRLLNTLFTATILTSALLLFAVQPMVSKMLLPPYGGAPAVWTTSVLFFQVVLLIGYTYSHFAPRLLGRRHPLLHLLLVVAPLAVLPVTLPAWAAPDESLPVAGWLLIVLAVMVGLPFAVLSTTGPLVQDWYARLGLPRSKDPYFLYAASNIGSLAALVGYPFLIEPALEVGAQTQWWTALYVAFVLLVGACAILTWRRARGAPPAAEPETAAAVEPTATATDVADTSETTGSTESTVPAESADSVSVPSAAALTWRRRLRWLALAALPSSLMQGVTSYMSMDVAAVPLLWVLPLALYLGTYIIAFGVRRHGWVNGVVDIAALLTIPVLVLALRPSLVPISVAMVVAMGMLTIVALACHGLLAKDRPAPVHLTEFFLIVSLGGAVGSVFNGVLAPVLFDRVIEYPVALIAVALLIPVARTESRVTAWLGSRLWTRVLPMLLAGAVYLFFEDYEWVVPLVVLMLALSAVLILRHRIVKTVALVVTGTLLVLGFQLVENESTVELGRSFFGSYSIRQYDDRRSLAHGTTNHGFQLLDPSERMTPVSYYARTGPVGDIFTAYGEPARNVAVVGLGTGVIAAYGQEGQNFDFYEIDPEMVRIAGDPEKFSYLSESKADIRTVVGDGRLGLDEAADGRYEVILLDAFTSDAIPAHMLTREALARFSEKLAPGGVIAVHVSNRALQLAPMVGATADAAGLSSVVRSDHNRKDDGTEGDPNVDSSEWLLLARESGDLDALTASGAPHADEWGPAPKNGPVWTDAYSSLFGVLG